MGMQAKGAWDNIHIPDSINGWTQNEDRFYDPESIFGYINGAGEVYRAYEFIELRARFYTKPEAPDIFADIFDMGSSRNAFGVFTHDREGEPTEIGQNALYKGGLLTFWKGRYYVSIYATRETESSRDTVLELGREIADSITQSGEVPSLIHQLPESGLMEKQTRFFFHPAIMNYHYFVADENILELSPETDAVLATYSAGKKSVRLLAVKYPDKTQCQSAYSSFLRKFMPDSEGDGKIQTEDGLWTAVRKFGGLLVIIFDAPAVRMAEDLFNQMEAKIK